MPSSASCGRGSWPSRSVPARDWRLRIEDILAAVERVQRYAAGMDLASFLADEKTVDAVSFCFGVIGEAAPTFQRTWSPPIPTCHGRRCAPCGTSWSTNTLGSRRRLSGRQRARTSQRSSSNCVACWPSPEVARPGSGRVQRSRRVLYRDSIGDAGEHERRGFAARFATDTAKVTIRLDEDRRASRRRSTPNLLGANEYELHPVQAIRDLAAPSGPAGGPDESHVNQSLSAGAL